MFKNLVLIVLTLGLSACAFDQDKDAAKQREVETNEKLSRTYKPVLGTYTGKLTTADGIQDVEVLFFELKVEDGKNSDGSTRFVSKLHATYKRINPVGASYDFVVGVSPSTGDLTMVNVVDLKNLGRDDIQTIDAKFNGSTIVGDAKAISGSKGIVTLNLKARESGSTDSSKEEFQYYERIRAQLRTIVGEYEGVLDQVSGPLKGEVIVSMRLYIQEVAQGTITVPTLMGEFNRADDPRNTTALNLSGSYEADLNPPRLTLTGKPRFNGATNYVATIYGVIANGQFEAEYTANTIGFIGNVKLKKKQ